MHEDNWGLISLAPARTTIDALRATLGPGVRELAGVRTGYAGRAGLVDDGFAFALTDDLHWNILYGVAPHGTVRELYLTFGELRIADALERLGRATGARLVHHAWDVEVDLTDRAALERFLGDDG